MKILDEIKEDIQSIKGFMAKFKPKAKADTTADPDADPDEDPDEDPEKQKMKKNSEESRKLLAKAQASLEQAQTDLDTSSGQVKSLENERTGAISRLDQFLAAAKIDGSKLTSLQQKLEAAIGSVTTILAKQGIDMSQIPAGTVDAGGGNKTKREQYSELVAKDPRAASKFYAENCEAILSGK